MTAERESMTLQEMDAPALGVEERRDEAPGPEPATRGQRRTRRSWPSRRGASSPRSIDCGHSGGGQRAARSPARGCTAPISWRRARREGSLQGLTPSKRGGLSCTSSRRKWLGWRRSCTPPIRSWSPSREKVCWDSASNTGRTADGRPGRSASQVGVAPACRALGVPRASFYRQRPAPGHQQPRPTPARALCASERAHVLDVARQPALRRPVTGRGRRDAAR